MWRYSGPMKNSGAEGRPDLSPASSTISARALPGLYVHVPFCRTKCPYCDFASVTSLKVVDAWMEALRRESVQAGEGFGPFDSLYLGGGTPSLLDERMLADLLEYLFGRYTFAEGAEVTIEVNPDDVTPERARHYRSVGINRVSVGVQSFDEEELRFLRRRHSALQARRALGWLRDAGFDNVGIDLMYSLPGQTADDWETSLRAALSFHPEHISAYSLTVEADTPFGRLRSQGKLPAADEEIERTLFLLAHYVLRGFGYLHYEISNYARGRENISRHNRKYWHHVPTLGLGPAAHSYRDGVRWWNVRDVKTYVERLQRGESPVEDSERLNDEQMELERVYLGFRTAEGVPLELLLRRPRGRAVLEELRRAGLVLEEEGRVRATLDGWLVADSLPLLFFREE